MSNIVSDGAEYYSLLPIDNRPIENKHFTNKVVIYNKFIAFLILYMYSYNY